MWRVWPRRRWRCLDPIQSDSGMATLRRPRWRRPRRRRGAAKRRRDVPKIRSRVLPDGRRRYSFRVDTGRGPDGRRIQEHRTFDRRVDAVAELARIMSESGRGLYVRPSRETLAEHLDAYLEGA